ncbi:MAG TPA: translocation/assembly module TamB domain-containing protein, partial [Thermodesulfovibrionales bacterium]|nr:translocation/assembly module TamB domain-containing protein [Thermodesulfovibrionales bacterium]
GRYDFLLQTFLKEVPEDLLVSMRGHADLSGDKNHFSAGAVVNQLNVTLFGYSFSSDSEIRLEVKDKKVIFPGMNLRGGTTAFKVRGSIEANKGYDLVMEGSSDLAPLKGFSKKIETIKGDVAFDLSVRGAWDNPRVNGTVTVSDGLIGIRGMPYQVSSINCSLTMSEDRVVIEKFSGRAGGGDISLSGIAYIQALKIKRFYIDSVLSNVRLDISKDFPANFSGTLLYRGTVDSQSLSGDIKVNHALYRERVDWQSWLLKAKAKERPRGEIGAFEKTSLNIRIQSTDNVVLDNNIARATLSLDLLLRGNIAQPVIFGRVEMLTGTVYFRNNEFKILSARADFSDPKRINPVMNIVAETSIQGYTIRLNLEGQFDHFDLSLTSNPSLEETEILSLLTVGTLQKESKGIQGGIGVSAATTFLSGQFQDVAQERIRSITGIDRVNVEQYTSQITGKTEPRVTATKRLGDRVSVAYSTALGSASSYIIKVEYDVTNNVSLIGLRDEAGGLGGGIKFRFGFK